MFSRPAVSSVRGSLHGLAIGFKPIRGPPARTGAGMNDLAYSESAVCAICMESLGRDSTANPWTFSTEMKTTQACVNGHVYHKGCLLKYMRSVTGRNCPECRQPMLKEVCDKLQTRVSGPTSLGANAPDPADGGLPVPQLPQPGRPSDIDEQIAHQRALASAANTPENIENVESGIAEIEQAETRVRITELGIMQHRERAAAAERSGDPVTARLILATVRREQNLLALHRQLLEGLLQTRRDWLVQDAALQEELRNAERDDLPPLDEAEVRGRLFRHRIRPRGWLQDLYHRPARERARALEQWLEAAAPPRTAPSAPLRPTNVVGRGRRSPTHSGARPIPRLALSDSDDDDDDGVDGGAAEPRERERGD